MSSVNKVVLLGNVGRDPEVRRTASGDAVVSFSIATSETWRDKSSGERKERTEWHNVVIFNEGLGKVAEQYVRKGSKVYIEGALQSRKWTDKEGTERFSVEVVLQRFRGELTLLDKPKEGATGERREERPSSPASGYPEEKRRVGYPDGINGFPARPKGGSGPMLDDDVPFAPEWR